MTMEERIIKNIEMLGFVYTGKPKPTPPEVLAAVKSLQEAESK